MHYTYIVNSEDCLVNITERPFPQDVILQVEVYSNISEVWQERERAMQELYDHMYTKKDSEKKFSSRGDGGFLSIVWIRDFCEANFVVNLTGTNFFCQLLLSELFSVNGYIGDSTFKDVDDALDNRNDVDEFSSNDAMNSTLTCGRRSFYHIIRISDLSSVDGVCFGDDSEMISRADFFSKNFALYDLIEVYSK